LFHWIAQLIAGDVFYNKSFTGVGLQKIVKCLKVAKQQRIVYSVHVINSLYATIVAKQELLVKQSKKYPATWQGIKGNT